MAAEFLEATADQPLLCLGAINPRLYARIPLLGRAHEMRRQAWGLLTMLKDHSSTANAMVGFWHYTYICTIIVIVKGSLWRYIQSHLWLKGGA